MVTERGAIWTESIAQQASLTISLINAYLMILFLCQRDYCHRNGTMLISDDFEAWQYGPVVPDVYREYSLWGGMRISSPYDGAIDLCEMDARFIDPIIETKRELYPWDLVEITHREDSPWAITFGNGEGNGRVIKKELICDECLN